MAELYIDGTLLDVLDRISKCATVWCPHAGSGYACNTCMNLIKDLKNLMVDTKYGYPPMIILNGQDLGGKTTLFEIINHFVETDPKFKSLRV